MARTLLGNPAALFLANDPAGTALTSRLVQTPVRFGPDLMAWQLEGSAEAADGITAYAFRLALSQSISLAGYAEIRFWLQCNQPADGSAERPYCLTFQVGLGGSLVGAWPLPVGRPGEWELQRLELGALSSQSIDWVEISWAKPSISFRATLDDLMAVRDEMITDADAALVELLDSQVEATAGSGTPAPAVVWQAGSTDGTAPDEAPYIRIMPYAIRLARDRTTADEARGVLPGGLYWLRPPSVAYDLYYQVEAVGGTRAQRNRLTEFILATLCPERVIWVGSQLLPVQWVDVASLEVPVPDHGPASVTGGGRTPVHVRVRATQEPGSRKVVPPVAQAVLAAGARGDEGASGTQESSKV